MARQVNFFWHLQVQKCDSYKFHNQLVGRSGILCNYSQTQVSRIFNASFCCLWSSGLIFCFCLIPGQISFLMKTSPRALPQRTCKLHLMLQRGIWGLHLCLTHLVRWHYHYFTITITAITTTTNHCLHYYYHLHHYQYIISITTIITITMTTIVMTTIIWKLSCFFLQMWMLTFQTKSPLWPMLHPITNILQKWRLLKSVALVSERYG